MSLNITCNLNNNFMVEQLNRALLKQLKEEGKCPHIHDRDVELDSPIRVIQFGEGNFIRGYIDAMLQSVYDAGELGGRVMMIKPRRGGDVDEIEKQDGLFTLIERGVSQGQNISRFSLITVVQGCLHPYHQWQEVLALADRPECRFVFSNTTEAGVVYNDENYSDEYGAETFPGKLTAFLYRRYCTFQGDNSKGMVIIPCELMQKNGELLRKRVFQYARRWDYPVGFFTWVKESCRFINTLVDRIISGYPKGEEEGLRKFLGYDDKLITSAEPYYELVLETDDSLEEELPWKRLGEPIVYTQDVAPYYLRKLRLLNALHTSCVPAGRLAGFSDVRALMQDPTFELFIKKVLIRELIPSLPQMEMDVQTFADQVLDRFRNPFASHKLEAITSNCIDKWRERVLPAIQHYEAKKGVLPVHLMQSLSAMILMYLTIPVTDKSETIAFFNQLRVLRQKGAASEHIVHAVMSNHDFWMEDLTVNVKWKQIVTYYLNLFLNKGIDKMFH